MARGRERADLDQLHVGHHRKAQGRDLHPPRRLPPRPRRRARVGHGRPTRAPVDAADVPLQRLVPDLGGDRGRRARTSACARSSPARIWELFDAEGVTHYSGAPTVHMSIVNHDKAHPLEQRVTVPTGGSPPSPTLLGQHARAQPASDPPLRADRDLRPDHGAARGTRSGTSSTPRSRRSCSPARARPTTAPTSCASSTTRCRTCPRDGETVGEVVMRGNSVMRGYWNMAEETEEAFRGGWFHSGDLGVLAPGRLRRAARPLQGHHHLRRREHLEHRGRAGARPPPGGPRGRGRGDARREVGRAAEGVRRAQAGHGRERGGADRLLPASTWPGTSARRRSSSGSCRGPRPARSRSSCCASASGPAGRRRFSRRRAAPARRRRCRAAGRSADTTPTTPKCPATPTRCRKRSAGSVARYTPARPRRTRRTGEEPSHAQDRLELLHVAGQSARAEAPDQWHMRVLDLTYAPAAG